MADDDYAGTRDVPGYVPTESYEDLVRRWLAVAGRSERHVVDTVSAVPMDRENHPGICACLEEQLNESTATVKRLQSFCRRRRISFEDAALHSNAPDIASPWADFTFSDQVIKVALLTYAYQKMQFALYRLLHAAAEATGDAELQRLCEETLWEKDGTVARLKHELTETRFDVVPREAAASELPLKDSAADKPEVSSPQANEDNYRHGIEIRFAGNDVAEVVVPLSMSEVSNQTVQSILTEASRRLSEAIAESKSNKEGPSPKSKKSKDATSRNNAGAARVAGSWLLS
jgi:ferritin-like metal-binding protein YciE